MAMNLFERLELSVEDGIMEPLDLEFARFLKRLDPGTPDIVILAGCLASHAVSRSNTCIDITALRNPDREWIKWAAASGPGLSPENLKAALESTPLAALPGDPGSSPLVFEDGRRLYLNRYFRYETILARAVSELAGRCYALDPREIKAVKKLLPLFFPGDEKCDYQRVAACTALLKGLCIVSGGPGTGKTRTVAAILSALIAAFGDISVAVAAPTGKAAARLKEAIDSAVGALAIPEKMQLKAQEAFTIHRLLGADSRGRFRHGSRAPLPFRAVAIDEASMVDLPLMTRLVSSLAPDARLILLGDKDQLTSVEAGNVLSDICSCAEGRLFSPEHAEAVREISGDRLPAAPGKTLPLGDCVIELKKNYRFSNRSGIADLADAICRGRGEKALEVLADRARGQARLITPEDRPLSSLISLKAEHHYLPCLRASGPGRALTRLQNFRILCAHREGPAGTKTLNRSVSRHLTKDIKDRHSRFFRGQPLIILRNSYRYSIFNGDICIVWPGKGQGKNLEAWFEDRGNAVRPLPLSILPEHETAFAITVHKSQGSEFDHVLLVLPHEDSPLLTRELLYTAVTRARKSVEIWGPAAALKKAVAGRTRRFTGLREKILRG